MINYYYLPSFLEFPSDLSYEIPQYRFIASSLTVNFHYVRYRSMERSRQKTLKSLH